MESRGYELLESKLGYSFKEKALLETALTHKSFVNENAAARRTHNQRLEFLGDAVLGLVVGHLLMVGKPALQEGELSMTRAEIVSESAVAEVAQALGLGEWLFLGRGEEHTGGRNKASILADACEALIAAVFLDGGYGPAAQVVERLFAPRIASLDSPAGFTDFKTRLQERAQAVLRETPTYTVTAGVGPDHAKVFQVTVAIGGRVYAQGGGHSKKEAEQRAAEEALFLLEGETYFDEPPPGWTDPET